MRVNFNNERKMNVTFKTLPAFLKKVEKKITGTSDHFWLSYKKRGKSIEMKWERTKYSDHELLKSVQLFIENGLKQKKSYPKKLKK